MTRLCGGMRLATKETSGTPRRTQAERRADAERKLIESTLQVIARIGISRTTMGGIAEEGGFSRGLPAHHFGNKDGLLKAVFEAVQRDLRELIVATEEPSGLEATLSLTRGYLALQGTSTSKAWASILAEAIFLDAPLRAMLREWNVRTIAQVAERIERGRKDGSIRADVNAQHQATILIGTLRGIGLQARIDPALGAGSGVYEELVEGVRRSLAA